MKISPANILDSDVLYAIQAECLEKQQWQDISYILDNPSFIILIAEKEDHTPCGFIAASISFEQVDILEVCVREDFRRIGVASKLLAALEKEVKARGATTLFLEVNEYNRPAKALYKKLGYSEIHVRKNYYGKDCAIVMQKNI